jgi:hypothetical protein
MIGSKKDHLFKPLKELKECIEEKWKRKIKISK